MLTTASHTRAVPGRLSVPTASASPRLSTPVRMLAAGPAPAIRASARGLGLSVPISVTPPSSHSVTRVTATPWVRATTACASS